MIELDITPSVAKLSFSPDGADPRPLSVELIAEKLAEAGVCHGILDDEIAKFVERPPERAVKGIVVARQLEPVAGRPAPVVRLLEDGQIAAAGDTLAELGAPVAAVDGKTVLGARIEAPAPHATELIAGPNARLVGGARIQAAIYGRVASRNEAIFVESLVNVSNDKLTAFMSIQARSSADTPISADMVREALQAEGIQYGIDDDRIAAALQIATETDAVLPKEIVAAGRPPVRGEDARLEFYSEVDQAVGEQRRDGSVNFRERGTIRNLAAGVMICRRVPPTAGRTQIDVYGLTDFAEPGHERPFAAGENVEKRGDEFWSTLDGAVMVRDDVVMVSDVYTVAGDVDLNVGNLRHEKGALRIKGTVRSGFEVYAATHIMIGELVEDATLQSGGDIEIGGGVIHAGKGRIVAQGSVTAKFAQNARIRAGGDVAINGAAINCDLFAAGRIVVGGGKSRLAGGIARAVGGIEVEQLGSELGAPTRVEVGRDRLAIEAIELRIAELEQETAAGTASTPDLDEARESLRALLAACDPNAFVVVRGRLHPGVTIAIGNARRTVTDASGRCRIGLDENREVQVTPIK